MRPFCKDSCGDYFKAKKHFSFQIMCAIFSLEKISGIIKQWKVKKTSREKDAQEQEKLVSAWVTTVHCPPLLSFQFSVRKN